MISYSQNQEDVVLFRLVQLVPEGFYVDVGAAHPVIDNVTYALYKAGWRGINIEPMKREADLLRELRPLDITFEVAAGDSSGRVTLYEAPIENRGATTADMELVEIYRSTGQLFGSFEVAVARLDKILEDNQIQIIHVLKIDVEGFELHVINGSLKTIKKHRPLIVFENNPASSKNSIQAFKDMINKLSNYKIFEITEENLLLDFNPRSRYENAILVPNEKLKSFN